MLCHILRTAQAFSLLVLACALQAQQVNQSAATLIVQSPPAPMAMPPPYAVTLCSGTVTSIVLASGFPSSAGVPMALVIGPAVSPGWLTTAGGQKVDLDLTVSEILSGALPGFWNSFFMMYSTAPASGAAFSLGFPTDSAPAAYAIQAAVLDPAASPVDGFSLSAAYSITRSAYVDLQLADNTFAQVPLGSWSFPFYDVAYTSVFISSNGRLTFGAGSIDGTETEAELRSGPPSINLFWDDLKPGPGVGSIRACADSGLRRLTCIFESVPEAGPCNPCPVSGANTATVVLGGGIPGQILVIYGSCTLVDAIAGISPGGNIDPVTGSGSVDLSACGGTCPATSSANATIFQRFTMLASPFDLSGRALTYQPTTMAPANRYIVY